MLNFLLARAREPSSYAGIAMLLTAAGIHLSSVQFNAVVTVCVAIAGAAAVFLPESKGVIGTTKVLLVAIVVALLVSASAWARQAALSFHEARAAVIATSKMLVAAIAVTLLLSACTQNQLDRFSADVDRLSNTAQVGAAAAQKVTATVQPIASETACGLQQAANTSTVFLAATGKTADAQSSAKVSREIGVFCDGLKAGDPLPASPGSG